jgi:hypothetical protein
MIPAFQTRSFPLDQALKDAKTVVHLDQQQLAAFEDLKGAITSDTFLRPFNADYPLHIRTDCSDVSAAAILQQEYPPGTWHTLAFMSSRLTSNQRNYDARDREILAAVKACRRYMDICTVAKSVIIWTDHLFLTHVFGRQKQSAQRLLRPAIFLSSFNIRFAFVKGSDNEPSDALSRIHMNIAKRSVSVNAVHSATPAGRLITGLDPPGDDNTAPPQGEAADSTVPETAPAIPGEVDDFVRPPLAILPAWVSDLIREQQADPTFREVSGILRGTLSAKTASSNARFLSRRMRIDPTGLLWSMTTSVPRLALPEGSVRLKIIEAVHETLGHPDAAAMLVTLSQYYYIREADKVLREYNTKCVVCLRSKHATVARGLAESMPKQQGRWLNV